jgi:hypothetical protein
MLGADCESKERRKDREGGLLRFLVIVPCQTPLDLTSCLFAILLGDICVLILFLPAACHGVEGLEKVTERASCVTGCHLCRQTLLLLMPSQTRPMALALVLVLSGGSPISDLGFFAVLFEANHHRTQHQQHRP